MSEWYEYRLFLLPPTFTFNFALKAISIYAGWKSFLKLTKTKQKESKKVSLAHVLQNCMDHL